MCGRSRDQSSDESRVFVMASVRLSYCTLSCDDDDDDDDDLGSVGAIRVVAGVNATREDCRVDGMDGMGWVGI
jgi:hypothetical protein